MKKGFISACGLVFLFLAKTSGFASDSTTNFFLQLSKREAKSIDSEDIHLDLFHTPSFWERYGTDEWGNKFQRIVFNKTFANGKDALYQGGAALAYYISPYVSLKTGPSWCHAAGIDRKWKWACQLNVELPITCFK